MLIEFKIYYSMYFHEMQFGDKKTFKLKNGLQLQQRPTDEKHN